MDLSDFFKQNPEIAIGFSGGADSAYLLYAAKKYAKKVTAYYVKTQFQPQFELDDVLRLAKELDAELKIIDYDILSHEEIVKNPKNRCYFCKRKIFELILEQAEKDGYKVFADGTNSSDDAADRPGIKALCELKISSPLKECGLEKTEIRKRSKEAGLFTWQKPAYACLATRIPQDEAISEELLKKIEYAENELFKMGFSDFRIRIFGGAARLQLIREEMEPAIKRKDEITKRLEPYFNIVLLDLKERK